ncbi:hypothetical protein HPG69_002237 [Diceros bicornis minor]|uniref:Peptidase S1 domain-containing protein n=1 Tax=Diceros bicornis minor TaxID=77932 RepID=A0A7J7FDL2_DICBM|nr:hypothetical protein HPG69_002237 [Diceros bicornis minor]
MNTEIQGNFLSGEIRWASEISLHSQPCMVSVLSYNDKEGRKSCGGFLVLDIIMLTMAHCNGRRISVTLGAHNIRKMENSQQLQNKAQLNWAVKTISLPWSQDWVRPGQVCSVAGWGRLASGKKGNHTPGGGSRSTK